MKAQEFDRILKRYLQDTATDKEKVLVEKWFNAMEQDVDIDPTLKAEIQEKIWRKLSTQQRRYAYSGLAKVAAAVALVIVGGLGAMKLLTRNASRDMLSVNGKIVSVHNDEQQAKQVVLPDGSYVVLEPNSTIDYPEAFGEQREVALEGEAFFQVIKNPKRPFLVYAQEVTTKVLGTGFSVKASDTDKEIVVAVKSGKVAVKTSADDRPEIILLPNQKAVFNRDENVVSRQIVDKPQLVVQQSTLKTSYVNEPVAAILKSLETNYGVEIKFDEELLAKCTLTSDMTEVGLYERIEIICNAIGASYQVSGVSVIIDAKTCYCQK